METYLSSVKNSCHLLKLFLDSPKELGVTDLSKRLGLSKGAVHKLLITLESEGLIRQNPNNKQYSLGYTLLELGNKVLKDHNMVEFARPYLLNLASATKELVCLCVIDGKDAIYVDKIDSQYPIRFDIEVYRRFPLYATSASRSILAFQDEAFIDAVLGEELRTFTPHSLKDPEDVKLRLAAIRERGYEMSSNLRNVGVTGIAAPIFDAAGQVIASISTIGPTDRMVPAQEQWTAAVLTATRTISSGLGYKG
ncbi:IclR family transcriptional regulator [Paenibacillus doosanensis]|uniref:IclR family transcriptional regulator n=1 Tax=Paenibacillus doosanensis TaxID=1229154 RepID=UPI00218029F6|nr:IclR family transcriptional regulator [Paenibacillus doosanensis]MCS7464180.1 IclR family transcriptional regulator [Paenibacillus doosanensis]